MCPSDDTPGPEGLGKRQFSLLTLDDYAAQWQADREELSKAKARAEKAEAQVKELEEALREAYHDRDEAKKLAAKADATVGMMKGEALAILERIPGAVRVTEELGAEEPLASLAVSVAKLVDERAEPCEQCQRALKVAHTDLGEAVARAEKAENKISNAITLIPWGIRAETLEQSVERMVERAEGLRTRVEELKKNADARARDLAERCLVAMMTDDSADPDCAVRFAIYAARAFENTWREREGESCFSAS